MVEARYSIASNDNNTGNC